MLSLRGVFPLAFFIGHSQIILNGIEQSPLRRVVELEAAISQLIDKNAELEKNQKKPQAVKDAPSAKKL